MSEALDHIITIILMTHGGCGLLAALILLMALFFLYKKRDYQTTIELVVIAWLFVFLNAAWGIMDRFRIIGGSSWYEIHLDQYFVCIGTFVLPTLLTMPIVWTCIQTESPISMKTTRWMILAAMIAFFNLIFYLTFFTSMLTWYIEP